MLHERLKIFVETFWVSGFCVNDFAVYVHGVVILERWVASEHLIHEDAERPPINSETMTLIQ